MHGQINNFWDNDLWGTRDLRGMWRTWWRGTPALCSSSSPSSSLSSPWSPTQCLVNLGARPTLWLWRSSEYRFPIKPNILLRGVHLHYFIILTSNFWWDDLKISPFFNQSKSCIVTRQWLHMRPFYVLTNYFCSN